MTFRKDESAGYLANHLARLFAKALHAEIRPLGLAPAQFMTLIELWADAARAEAAGETSVGLTQRDLVERLDVEQATMANTLARMERDGLIERVPHPEDGRARLVRLTATGAALEEPATQAAASVNRRALAPLSKEDRERFIANLKSVMDAIR